MAYRHEHCGGELKKYGKKPGRYHCSTCRKIVDFGRSGGYGAHVGYVKAQHQKK